MSKVLFLAATFLVIGCEPGVSGRLQHHEDVVDARDALSELLDAFGDVASTVSSSLASAVSDVASQHLCYLFF